MFPNNISLKSGSFYLNDKQLTDKLPEYTFGEEIPEYVKSIKLNSLASAEFELETEINIPLFKKLTGYDAIFPNTAQSFTMEYSQPYQEQRRKHKKKRINKKWAKRYGYVTKFRKWRINEVSLVSNGGLQFEATGRNVELLKG